MWIGLSGDKYIGGMMELAHPPVEPGIWTGVEPSVVRKGCNPERPAQA